MVLRCPLLKTSELAGHFLRGEPHAALGLGVQVVKNHPKNDSMVLYPKIQVMNRELKGIKSEKTTNPCESSLSTNPMKL